MIPCVTQMVNRSRDPPLQGGKTLWHTPGHGLGRPGSLVPQSPNTYIASCMALLRGRQCSARLPPRVLPHAGYRQTLLHDCTDFTVVRCHLIATPSMAFFSPHTF